MMSRPAFFIAPWDLHRELACIPRTPSEGTIVLVESVGKGNALPYHRKKLVFVLSAMHHFAERLSDDGFEVEIIRAPTYVEGIQQHVHAHTSTKVVALRPREWGLSQAFSTADFGIPLELHDDGGPSGHFFLTRSEFADWAAGKKRLRMANFYQWMRKRTGYLMDGDRPIGGKWSFDAENRKPARGHRPPESLGHPPDTLTKAQMARVSRWPGHWGEVEGFDWAVTRDAALQSLEDFFSTRAADFGRFQDAMLRDEPFMWHALVSTAMNVSLVSPREVCDRVVGEFEAGRMPLAAAEGFLRQILGWREFIRGVYWTRMPQLRHRNLLGATRPLPDFYWHPQRTDLECLRQSIDQVRETGYAHHIHRLMVQGNFALLAGIDPRAINHWFWSAFVDAYEWVELPNVSSMAIYADDTFATKPYAASGSYIHKMSDYCRHCPYDVKRRTGPQACPFNALYWHFMVRHRERFEHHPRLSMLFRTWEKLPPDERSQTLATAQTFLDTLRPSAHRWSFDDDAG